MLLPPPASFAVFTFLKLPTNKKKSETPNRNHVSNTLTPAEHALIVLKERSVPFTENVVLQPIYQAVVAMQLLS